MTLQKYCARLAQLRQNLWGRPGHSHFGLACIREAICAHLMTQEVSLEAQLALLTPRVQAMQPQLIQLLKVLCMLLYILAVDQDVIQIDKAGSPT